ncbi:hypothetical protein BBJ28_00012994 [Nothophytophthora sp. Chile5]|nr:hypothetical protein BBJ28_00012994 [Nothophytophthora sp. Chile5]
MPGSAAAPSPPRPAAERVRGLQSGELFVRLNGASLCAPRGVLHGAQPFLLSLLQLQHGGESIMQQFVAPSSSKLAFSRQMRRQTRQGRRVIEQHRRALQDAVEGHDVMTHRLLSPPAKALERYLQQFRSLEKAYKQHATSDILSLYALLEAEGQYIAQWRRREKSACRDQRTRTTLLYRFNLFALQLESETSGQIRMWRLPTTDAQRLRCVKAATENVKKRFFASSGCSLEVLDVFKLDNRVLLQAFQRFTSSIATSETELKIKGLFCCVPTESVERCVVYGMHTGPTGDSEDTGEEPSVLDPQGTGAKIFNRPTVLQGREEAPGTHQAFRARSKVLEGPLMRFPRRFSRYSTLEEMRPSLAASEDDEPAPIQYLALCRVAMGQTVRVKGRGNQQDVAFPDDPSEYVVRYPEAVVPEFLVQIRMVTPVSRTSKTESIIPVSLTSSVANLASNAFQDWIYSSALNSQAAKISAFPLALYSSHQTQEQRSVFAHEEELSPSNSPATPQQEAESASRKEEERASPETVLANCARQKASLREDLSRLERLFWRRAREIWEEESVSTGIERSGEHGGVQTDNQLHSARDGAPYRDYQAVAEPRAMARHLREELNLARRLEADLARLELQSQAKTRPRSSRKTENAKNAVNDRRRR